MVQRALVLQPFGIGDCIFSYSLIHKFIEAGYEVTWPVEPHFVEGLRNAYPLVNWQPRAPFEKYMNIQKECEVDGYLIIPIRWSMEITRGSYNNVMAAKYEMYGLNWQDWKEHLSVLQFSQRWGSLQKHLGIENREKYNLINNNYQSDFNGKTNIHLSNGLRCIYMSNIKSFSLFDWQNVVCNAHEIHTVSTSLIYLLELWDIKCPIHLYPRPTDPNFDQVKYLFTKPYVLH